MRNLVPFAVVGSNSIIEVFHMIFLIICMIKIMMIIMMMIIMIMIISMMKMMVILIIVKHNIQDENGRKSRGRSYPWGTVNIEERQHCDFQVLKNKQELSRS